MANELKIRVADYQRVEADLLKNGAVFREERRIVDTYFHQQVPHEVLKIQRDQDNDWLVHLKPRNGGFEIVRFDKIDDADRRIAELTEKFGVMSVLRKRCLFYDWDEYFLDFNLIEDYGDFLVLTGENPTPEMFAQLGIENPELITVPFNELPKQG